MTPRNGPRVRSRTVPLLVGLLVLVVIIALTLAGRRTTALVPAFSVWIQSLGAWSRVSFVLGYILATVAFVPGSLLTLAAGAIFGLAEGIALVFVGATVGASAAFLIARYLLRRPIERWLATDERLAAVDHAIGAEGRRLVVLLRLSPIFPFNVLNYALGVTRVRFADYLIASLGMLPGTALYVYWGKVVGDVARLASGAVVPHGPVYYLLLWLGLLATIAVVTLVTRTARRALRESTGGDRVAG